MVFLRKSLQKKIQHQWVLLAILYGSDRADGSLTRKEIDDLLRKNGIRIAYSLFARIKKFITKHKLINSYAGKYNELFFTPNYRTFTLEIAVADKVVCSYMNKEDYKTIMDVLADKYVRDIFFDPSLWVTSRIPLYNAIELVISFSNVFANLPPKKEFVKNKLVVSENRLTSLYSLDVARLLRKILLGLEKVRKKDSDGLYESCKLLSKLGRMNIRVTSAILNDSKKF